MVGVAAIALGTAALVSSLDSDDATQAVALPPTVSDADRAISLLANRMKRMLIANWGRRIIFALGANGRGVLVLDGLGPAPAGRAYQAWVIKPNAKAPSFGRGLRGRGDGTGAPVRGDQARVVVAIMIGAGGRITRADPDAKARRPARDVANALRTIDAARDVGSVLAEVLRAVQRSVRTLEQTGSRVPVLELGDPAQRRSLSSAGPSDVPRIELWTRR